MEDKKNIIIPEGEEKNWSKLVNFVNSLDISYLDKCLLVYESFVARNLYIARSYFEDTAKQGGISKNYYTGEMMKQLSDYLESVSVEDRKESAKRLLPLIEEHKNSLWENPEPEIRRLSGSVMAPKDYE